MKKEFLPWLVWAVAVAYYFCDYSARVSSGVMLPELQQALQVTAVGLGSLSAYFYYPYVAMQIPVGLLVDRISIRYLLMVMSILTAVGCIVFGNAQHLGQAELGRFLIGFSAAFAFVSALKLAAEWFPPKRLGLLAGLTQALGMLGAAMGEAPVSYSVSAYGWRYTMFGMSVIFILLSIVILCVVRDRPANKPKINAIASHPKYPRLSVWRSLKIVLSNRQTWLNALYSGLVFAPTAVLGEYWGVSFLQFGHGFEYHTAAFANGLIFIGWAVGGPLAGWLSDRIGLRRPLMFFSPVMGLIIVSILLLVPTLTPYQAYFLLFIYGVTNIGVAIAYAVATEINSKIVVGAAIAFTNMASIMVGAFLQPVVGKLADIYAKNNGIIDELAEYNLSVFRAALWILPICSCLAIVCAFFIRETHCRTVEKEGSDRLLEVKAEVA